MSINTAQHHKSLLILWDKEWKTGFAMGFEAMGS
jgi:hypothetical protein